jgi:hypothetical protein
LIWNNSFKDAITFLCTGSVDQLSQSKIREFDGLIEDIKCWPVLCWKLVRLISAYKNTLKKEKTKEQEKINKKGENI